MTYDIKSLIYFIPTIFIYLAILDIVIKFSRPRSIKYTLLIILISTSIISTHEINFYPEIIKNDIIIWFIKLVIYIATLHLFGYFFYKKLITRNISIPSCIVIVLAVIAKILANKIVPLGLSDIFTERSSKIIYLTGVSVLVRTYIKIYRKLRFSDKDDLIYEEKIKTWLLIHFGLLVITLINNTIIRMVVLDRDLIVNEIMRAGILTSSAIIYLYRPAFMNNTNYNITLNYFYKIKTNKDLNNDFFELEFTNKYVYLNKDFSIDAFSKLLNVNKDSINQYANLFYKMDFIDLVNKKRIDYLIELMKLDKYKSYTLEELSEKSGFGSRSSMNRAFKKFHGGSPSDLMKVFEK